MSASTEHQIEGLRRVDVARELLDGAVFAPLASVDGIVGASVAILRAARRELQAALAEDQQAGAAVDEGTET